MRDFFEKHLRIGFIILTPLSYIVIFSVIFLNNQTTDWSALWPITGQNWWILLTVPIGITLLGLIGAGLGSLTNFFLDVPLLRIPFYLIAIIVSSFAFVIALPFRAISVLIIEPIKRANKKKKVETEINNKIKEYGHNAEMGDIAAMENLANAYEWAYRQIYESTYHNKYLSLEREIAEKELSIALSQYGKLAELEDIQSLNELANAYSKAYDRTSDISYKTKSEEYIRQIAELELKAHIERYKCSADSGDLKSMENLERAYLDAYKKTSRKEYKTKADEYIAMQLKVMLDKYGDAAERGNLQAIEKLEPYYEKSGKYAEVIKLYTHAADKGDVDAQFALAVCYDTGKGVKKDPYLAFQWYYRAAENGDSTAQQNVAYCYSHGYGVRENNDKAMMWLERAANNGNEYCKKLLKEIEEERQLQRQRELLQPVFNEINALRRENEALRRESGRIAEERNKKIDELNDSVRKHQEQVKAVENELWKLNNK